ncbi:MAG: DUF5916 domain-containing protein [Gemmatimonadaceae bacterium]
MSFPEFSIRVLSAGSALIRGQQFPRASSFFRGLALIVALAANAAAQHGPSPQSAAKPVRTARALIVSQKPLVDGQLDDPAWKSAVPLSGFLQRELHEGQAVTERTEVRVVTDGEAIYVGAWMYDREPASIVEGEKIRDASLENSDSFTVILDTYLDRQNGFVFATTPAGIEYDGQVAKEGEGGGVFVAGQNRATAGAMGGFNLNWDGSWTVASSRDSLGWYAEFRIPFSTLRYGGGSKQTWGVNFGRRIRRKNEDAYWSFIPRQFNLYRLSRAGTIELAQLPVPRLATATPYVLGSVQRDFVMGGPTKQTTDWGVDAKYGLTPSLTVDLTYNTDFAQVEVDEQRTNLTRFPLFFPEKRPFFLENAGVFSAGTPQAVDLFFTRRIGIDTLGRPVPIVGGGRVSGRVGGFTVGALEIVTDEVVAVQPSNSYFVARITRELGTRSRIGAIGVHRMALDSAANRNGTYGFDARIGASEAWTFDAWGAKTATPSRNGDDYAFSGRANYATAAWSNTARVVRVGPAFNPEVGFLNRTGGYEFYELSLMRLVRNPRLTWMKQWNPHTSFRGYFRPDGDYQSGQIHIDMTEVEFANGGRFGPELNVFHEGLQQPFAIASNVTLPVGSYDFATFGLDWSTNPSAPVSLSFRGDVGPFYNGTRSGGSATVTLRRGASLSSSLSTDYNDVRLDQGRFVRQLIGARVAYFFTPRIFLQSLMQYSNQARVWTANARLGWLSTAGTGLFIVVNDGEEAEGLFNWSRPQSRSLVIKYTRQIGTGG